MNKVKNKTIATFIAFVTFSLYRLSNNKLLLNNI